MGVHGITLCLFLPTATHKSFLPCPLFKAYLAETFPADSDSYSFSILAKPCTPLTAFVVLMQRFLAVLTPVHPSQLYMAASWKWLHPSGGISEWVSQFRLRQITVIIYVDIPKQAVFHQGRSQEQ